MRNRVKFRFHYFKIKWDFRVSLFNRWQGEETGHGMYWWCRWGRVCPSFSLVDLCKQVEYMWLEILEQRWRSLSLHGNNKRTKEMLLTVLLSCQCIWVLRELMAFAFQAEYLQLQAFEHRISLWVIINCLFEHSELRRIHRRVSIKNLFPIVLLLKD